MNVGERLLQRLVGGEIERALRPLLVTAGLGVAATYMFWSMFALWAIDELEMTKGDVGLAYLGAALLGMVGGFAGGALSDRLGRRPVILVSTAIQLGLAAILVVPSLPVPAAVAVLLCFGLVQPIRGATYGALLADLVPEGRRTLAFGSFRVAFNAGALIGPIVAGALATGSWAAVHVGIVVALALSGLSALRLPRVSPPVAGSRQRSLWRLVCSRVFFALLVAGVLASTTYNAFETLFPISLTQEHGYEPLAWGVLFGINPLLVTLMQLRVTRWSEPLPMGVRLAVGLALMGTPFLALLVNATPIVLALIVVVFVIGEMLWSPNADALTARAAPVESRGAFLGALGVSTWIGGAIAPAVGLRVADAAGDAAMWSAIAGISLAGGAVFLVADRLVATRSQPEAQRGLVSRVVGEGGGAHR
ncbi:MAG: MFS transporter [Gaiellales bacterium]